MTSESRPHRRASFDEDHVRREIMLAGRAIVQMHDGDPYEVKPGELADRFFVCNFFAFCPRTA